jgi:small basic protein
MMAMRFSLQKTIPAMRVFDWLLASGSFAYGVYLGSWIWLASGVLGFGLAWYNPGARIRRRLSFIKPAPGGRPR